LPVTTSSSLPPPTTTTTSTAISSPLSLDSTLWSVVDPDVVRENPVEDKNRRLVRSHRSSPYDRELKPNAKIRDELAVCFQCAPVFSSFSSLSSGYIELRPKPTTNIGRERPHLEIPILPDEGQTGSNKVSQIGHMARFI